MGDEFGISRLCLWRTDFRLVRRPFGRKLPLIISAVLFSASAWGTAVATDFDWFVFYRIVGGVGIGLASALSPMYIAEVSPAENAGNLWRLTNSRL